MIFRFMSYQLIFLLLLLKNLVLMFSLEVYVVLQQKYFPYFKNQGLRINGNLNNISYKVLI